MTGLAVLLVVGLVLGGAGFAIRGFIRKIKKSAAEMSQLVQSGEAVTARIAAAERRRRARGSGNYEYYATYAFKARDGNEYSREYRVQASRFDEYKVGMPIDIVYLPGDPNVSATREIVDKVRNTPRF